MTVRNIALLAALLPAVLAVPQHGSIWHGPHRGSLPPGGWPLPTGGPFQSSQVPLPSGASGSAPFPAGNSTAAGATATGTGLVTIRSTINLIPVPLTSSIPVAAQSPATTGAAGAGGPGGSGQSASPSSPGSPAGGSGGPGQAGNTCGPATVTVTTANTVTVTVQASPSPSPNESLLSSAPVQSSAAPYPVYNSSIPVGPTGTGTISTSYVTPAPPSSSASPSSSLSTTKIVQQASDGQVVVSANPVEAGVTATPSPSVAVKADYHQPAPAAKAPAAAKPPAPVVPASVVPASVVPAPVVPAPASSSPVSITPTIPSTPASSAPTSTGSAGGTGSTGSTGVKARGLLYSYNNQALAPADSLAQANAAINDAIGWMANWDSSPATGSGKASGSGKVEYVAQLWGTDATHTNAWSTNANTPWLMGFNEPDNCGGGGACLTPQAAAAGHTAHIAGLRTGTTKVTTPCTQNNVGSPGIGSEYMATFLAQFPSNSFDAIAFHWYGPGTAEGLSGADNPQSLKATVAAYQKLQKQYGIAELWITEGGPESAASGMVSTFLEWLDDPSNGVDRYLWNGLNSPTSVVEVGSGSSYMSS